MDLDSKILMARNPNTPVEVLKVLASDKNKDVRRGVALNPNTPVEDLKVMVTDENKDVRRDVAANPNTPVAVLKVLAEDKEDFRLGFVRNPNTPVEVLEKLAKDQGMFTTNHSEYFENNPITAYVDPGNASTELLTDFYLAISALYRANGGLGLKIIKDERRELIEEMTPEPVENV